MSSYAITGIALGLGSMLLLVGVALVGRRGPLVLSDGIVVFLAGAGLAAGIRVCAIALDSHLLSPLDNDRTFIFLGGLAVVWVSVETIWKSVKRLRHQNGR